MIQLALYLKKYQGKLCLEKLLSKIFLEFKSKKEYIIKKNFINSNSDVRNAFRNDKNSASEDYVEFGFN